MSKGIKIKTVKDKIPDMIKTFESLSGKKVQVGVFDGENAWLARIHEYGCDIRAKKAQYLTIPISPKSIGKKAGEFDNLFFVQAKSGEKFLARDVRKGEIELLYWLTKSVKIPERSFLRAGFDENVKEINKYSDILLKKVATGEMSEREYLDNIGQSTSRLTEYLVLCGRGMFTAVENINIEIETIEKIKKFIDERKESVVFYIELFTQFKELLNRTSNINNYHFLHGVLLYYYPEEYTYARDYLTKKENCISATLGDRIKKVFADNRCPIHKNDLKLFIPGVSEAMLLRAIHEEKELFQWEHNYYFSAQMLSISVTDIEYIHNTILNIMNENFGYCSDNLLYNKVINKLENCFKDNNIKSPSNLFYICTYLFSDEFDFRIPHIGRKGMFDAISMKEIALSMLKNIDEISFNKYSNIAEHLMWAMGTRGMVFSDIEKEYIRISDDRYIKRELFRISDEEIGQIESVICQKMKNNFLSLINFESWGLLPNIKYEWNSFLLRSIIEKLSSKLKIIETRKKNRNFERGIIVNVDSSFSEYSEVVANYLKENGYSTISKSKLLSILIETGLTYKIIPKELYNSESIKYLDEEFVVV